MNRLARLAELRRALPLLAAGLLVTALLVPMWRIVLTAPQYPGQDLVVELYAYPRLGGDYAEVQALNKYVGFHYPDPVYLEPNYEVHEAAVETPEWSFGPLAFLAVAATGVFVALAPTVRKLRLGLACQLAGTVAVFGIVFAVIQYRLYQAGHELDPNAPLRGVEGFTPPVVGTYEVANISGNAWFGPGGYMTATAVALLVVAFWLRDDPRTIRDLPAMARATIERWRRRLIAHRPRGRKETPRPRSREESHRPRGREESNPTTGDLR